MDIRCPRCDGNVVQLLKRRPDGSMEYVCVGCSATTVLPDPNNHEQCIAATLRARSISPYQPKNWEGETDKIAKLRNLRLAIGKKRRTGRQA